MRFTKAPGRLEDGATAKQARFALQNPMRLSKIIGESPTEAFPMPMIDPRQSIARRRPRKNVRALGAIFFAMGGTLLYLCAILPLQDAMQHAPVLGGKFSGKGLIVGFALLVVGLALIIGGRRASRLLKPQPWESKVPVIIISIVIALGGVAIYIITRSQIESLGYVFRF